ncbi:hypothetical protein ACJZ2D_013141 [Fusarium nematophilum]
MTGRSRRVQQCSLSQGRGQRARIRGVDSLTATLQGHKTDTVVSTINLETDAGSQAQLGLIAAAEKSQTTQRFIPNKFVSVIDEDDPSSGPGMGGWIPNTRALKKTSLEYIRISIGFFSDYWGMAHMKSNLKPFQWFLDVEKGIAVVPGSGVEKFTVTYSEDLARVIVRLLDMADKWPKRGFLSGSDISLNELVASAEKIRPGLCRMIIAGTCVLPNDDRRLDKRFPDIPLTSAEEILAKAWKGK